MIDLVLSRPCVRRSSTHGLCLTVYRLLGLTMQVTGNSETHENSVDVHGTLRADENRSKRNGHLEYVYTCACFRKEVCTCMIHPHLESLSHVNKISRFVAVE